MIDTTPHTRYALITARSVLTDEYQRPHYQTCGHFDSRCSAIKPTSHRLPTRTLAEYLERNEHFDGEVIYANPFPCPVCVIPTDSMTGWTSACMGGTCHSILDQCSRHSAQYQRRYGRAGNE